ncbi:MAG: hypothetical protein FD165_1292 [Gammaproteobacteria bacterium]|nr:MAG: hypothetical protein FD165_1292 [Gammaproteobacteria bacterium]TND05791.1 MAG: hypothetical protein FD120_1004 [Gammaproteobacteria bacterium]
MCRNRSTLLFLLALIGCGTCNVLRAENLATDPITAVADELGRFATEPESSSADDAGMEPVEPAPAADTGEPGDVPVVSDPDTPEQGPVIFEKIDVAHAAVSSRIERTARWLDRFFADDKVFEEATGSYARVNLDSVFEPGGAIGFSGDIRLKIDLPRTQQRLKLLIESDPQRENRTDLENVPVDVVAEKSYSLSLERQLQQAHRWDVRPALGIKAHTPLDPFARLRAIRYFNLQKVMARVSSSAFWFDSSGFGANFGIEFDRALSDVFLLRSGTGLTWEEAEKFRRIEQQFSLFHRLDDRRNLAYQIGILADDEFNWRVNTYYFRIRYRKDLHDGWVFAEIIPQWTYREETNFDDEPSLTLRLEAVFGHSTLK